MTLEQDLPRLLDELADDHVVGSPPSLQARDVPLTLLDGRRRTLTTTLAVAVGTAVVIGGLVAIVANRDIPGATTGTPDLTEPAFPTTAPVGAVVLAPQPDSKVVIESTQDWDRTATAAGALVDPDGTVFSITVSSGSSWLPDHDDWDAIPADRRDVQTLAGYEVASVVDASSPTQIYRMVRDDCWSIEVVSAGVPMWSDDVATLLAALRVNREVTEADGAVVTVEIPPGWVSLGGGRMLRSWAMELTVDVDGEQHSVHLAQVPNAPVGFMLSGESNPRPFDHAGEQWWTVDIVTTPGMTSVIGGTSLGAFHVTSDLSADQLVTIIDSLTPTSVEQLSAQSGDPAADDGMTVDTAAPPASGCGSLGTGLELLEP